MLRRFELHRDQDPGGVSGTGVVADGVAFPDDVVMLRWRGAWPTSICWYDRGIAAVEHIHGHGGRTRLVWVDDPRAEVLAQRFHEAYERLAPHFSYQTRAESAVPWNEVPDANRQLMVAVCEEILAGGP